MVADPAEHVATSDRDRRSRPDSGGLVHDGREYCRHPLRCCRGAVSQALFAEAGNEPERLARNARNALRGIYIVMIPVVALVVLIAHPILSILGPSYASHGTFVLRVLTVGSLSLGGTYVIDATAGGQRSHDRLHRHQPRECGAGCGVRPAGRASGIGAVALSWALAQAASLAVGACILAGPSAFAKRKRDRELASSRTAGPIGAGQRQLATLDDSASARDGRPAECHHVVFRGHAIADSGSGTSARARHRSRDRL